MAKRIVIPNDLWYFVGCELFERGYINRNALLRTKETPKIRWELLGKEEWQACSHLNMLNLKGCESKEVGAWEEASYINMYVAETLKRKKLLKKYPETKRLVVEKGFINFDNVVLMSESRTEDLFREVNQKSINLLNRPLIFSLDAERLAIFILELIHIYQFRAGQDFIGKMLDDGILENQILLSYLEAHSLEPKNFELETRTTSKERERNEERFFKNMWNALNQKKPSILRDNKGKEIAKFDIGRLFRENEGKIEVDFGSFGLKVEGNFVGLGHILYDSEYLGAQSIQEVLESWNWLLEKTHVDSEILQMALNTSSLIIILKTGIEEGLDVYIFNLAINLRRLESLGVNVTPKIEEFGEEIRGHIRSFQKWEKKRIWEGIVTTQKLRKYLCNVSSECYLALISKFYGLDVRLGKHPDLIINDKKVEVKRASSYNLSSSIKSAQGQIHDIIAIKVDSLKQRPIPHHEATWLNEEKLKDAIMNALTLRQTGDIVLLFMTTLEGLKGRIILLEN